MTVIVGASMLTASQHITFAYQVGDQQGAVSGSSTGILVPGQRVSQPLSELSNKGFIPVVATITSNDSQLSFNHTSILLQNGSDTNASVTVSAVKKGDCRSIINVGIFYPFLPQSVIYGLSAKSYWLALAVLSLIPGLPFMCFPLLDRKVRFQMRSSLRTLRFKLNARNLLLGESHIP